MAFIKNFQNQQKGFFPYEIIFSVTDICNLKCKHCYIKKNNQKLDINATKKFLSSINSTSSENPITHIGFSGGEPFLHPTFIEEIVKVSVENDLLFDCIMTNGVWWKNQDELKNTLQKIYDAGFDGKIGISFDYFHALSYQNSCKNENNTESNFSKNNISSHNFSSYLQKISDFCYAVFEIWQDSSMIKIQSVNYMEKNHIFNPQKLIKQLPDCFDYQVFIIEESYTTDDRRAWKNKKWFKEDFCSGPGQILYIHSDGRIAPCCGFANENEKLIIGNINQSFDQVIENAKKNQMVKLCYIDGLSSKIKELKKQKLLPKGKTKDNCTFCDFICKLK